MPGVYTVTQMNSYIKNMFRQDFVLSRISVKVRFQTVSITLPGIFTFP